MSREDVQSETSRQLTENYQTSLENLLLGGDSMQGVVRMIAFIGLYIVIFGTFFFFIGN